MTAPPKRSTGGVMDLALTRPTAGAGVTSTLTGMPRETSRDDRVPRLVGGASPEWMIEVGRQIADAMPNGRHRILEGQEHLVAPEILVPVLAEFFTDRNDARYGTERRKEPT